jgi:PAS domain S-box-containing protein
MGSGLMPDLVRAFDWGSTALGPLDKWSDTLVSNVNQVLCSPIPAILSWGDDFIFFYNEAAIPALQGKHPGALGASYREVYKEVWHLFGQDLEDCYYRGATVIRESMLIPLLKNGVVQDSWFTYFLTPIFENGKIAGIYVSYQNMTQAILAERERARNEERVELALSAATGVGIWDWDVPGDLVYTDARFAEIYGVDPADAKRGISIASFTANIHKDDVERVGTEIAAAVASGSEFSSEYRLLQRDGSVRWVFAKGRCYLDAEGKPLRFPGVTIDITSRKEMEAALSASAKTLRKNEEKFRTFVEAISDVVYRVNADWSEALQVEGRGFLPDTRNADPDWFTRNVHPDDQARVLAAIQRSVRDGSIFEMEHKVQRLDGTQGWTFSRAIPVCDENGTITEWLGAASDITESKKQHEALRISEESLRIAADAVRLGYTRLDLASREMHDCNAVFLANYGRKADGAFKYEELLASIHPDDLPEVQAAIQSAIRNDTLYRAEYRVFWPDGSLHWLLARGVLIRDEHGQPWQILGVTLDVTERHLAQRALLQNEKLAAVGRLASSIAHEINNPLEAVTNLLYLSRHSNDVAEIHKMLDSAEEELRRVSNITSQTLRFHRQSSKPQSVTSTGLFSAVLSMYAGKLKNSRITVERRERPEQPVVVYEGDIRQVLNNLIGNAIDAMPQGGRLMVRNRNAFDWKTEQAGIALTVADTGSGIAPEQMAKIFEAFFTTKGIGGTGLGLWISREIMDRHRGHLRIRSSQREGHRGTVAIVFLPYHNPIAEMQASNAGPVNP